MARPKFVSSSTFPFINGIWLNWPLVKAVDRLHRYDCAVQHRPDVRIGLRRSPFPPAPRPAPRSGCAGIWRWPSRCPSRSRPRPRRRRPSPRRTPTSGTVAERAGTSFRRSPRWNRPAAQRRHHVDAGVLRARGLAAKGDVVLVAAELGDVALHPFQHGLLVEDAVVAEEMAFVIQRGMRQQAHQVQAILEGDDDGFAVRGHLAAVVAGRLAVEIAAAVNPDDHRKPAPMDRGSA